MKLSYILPRLLLILVLNELVLSVREKSSSNYSNSAFSTNLSTYKMNRKNKSEIFPFIIAAKIGAKIAAKALIKKGVKALAKKAAKHIAKRVARKVVDRVRNRNRN